MKIPIVGGQGRELATLAWAFKIVVVQAKPLQRGMFDLSKHSSLLIKLMLIEQSVHLDILSVMDIRPFRKKAPVTQFKAKPYIRLRSMDSRSGKKGRTIKKRLGKL